MSLSKNPFRHFFNFSLIILTALVSILTVNAQSSRVDLSFNAVPSKETTATVRFLIQPDRKILVFSGNLIVNGTPVSSLARLNVDGSLDNSFNCQCVNDFGSAILQPNGKIIIAGSVISTTTGTSASMIQRLNSDGSIDGSFYSPFAAPVPQGSTFATVHTLQPDGKILVQVTTFVGGSTQSSVIRLNPNGSIDNTFTTIALPAGMLIRRVITKVAVTPEGKILLSASFSSGGGTSAVLVRYNSDGSSDTTFESPILTPSNFNSLNFDLQADGKIIISGRFDTVNGISRRSFARLEAAGNVDLSFVPANIIPAMEDANRARVMPNGQILVSTTAFFTPGFPPPVQANKFFRFNSDGSADNTINSPANITEIGFWELDSAGKIVVSAAFVENGVTVYRLVRLNADGSIDNTFNVNFELPAAVSNLAIQPDNKVIVYGDFIRMNGIARNGFARLNADGSTDTTFDSGSGFNAIVNEIIVQSDGKILVGGEFSTYNGISRIAVARLNSDGSLDTAFNPVIGFSNAFVSAIKLQTDSKILIGGNFDNIAGTARTDLARLNPDGSLDTSFNAIFGSGSINDVALQSDGKIMIGGTFTSVNGFNRTNLVRLNADGSLDSSFNAGSISVVKQIELQSDGKYVILRNANTVVRLNNNGTADSSFQSPSIGGGIYKILVEPDGSIIVGRNLASGVVRSDFVRLRPNGTLESGITSVNANGSVFSFARQSDGKFVIVGNFSRVDDVLRVGIARLTANIFTSRVPYDFDGDGKTDLTVFRPSNGVWYLQQSTAGFTGLAFGTSGDIITPADYDGDGKTDIAVFRPSSGVWYLLRSQLGFTGVEFGAGSDIPVPGDYDGDGKAEIAVFRPSTGIWYTTQNPATNFGAIQFGQAGDKPVPADYDGDGKTDLAVFRPSNGVWYIQRSQSGFIGISFGASDDKLVPADYDGDGKAEIAVFRPSTGYWFTSTNPAINYGAVLFGANGDLPVPADYDGDGKADLAVFRPSNGVWYLQRSSQGFTGVLFGVSEDKPIPNAFIR